MKLEIDLYIPVLPLMILYETNYGPTEAFDFLIVATLYVAAAIDSIRWLLGRVFK